MLGRLLIQGGVNGAATYITAGRSNGRLTVFGNGEGVGGIVGDARFLAAAGALILGNAVPSSARGIVQDVGVGAAHSLISTEAIRAKTIQPPAVGGHPPPPPPGQLAYDAYGNAYSDEGDVYAADPAYVYG